MPRAQEAQERRLSDLHGIWHMDVRRDCLSFARHISISMAAEVMWSLFQDMP